MLQRQVAIAALLCALLCAGAGCRPSDEAPPEPASPAETPGDADRPPHGRPELTDALRADRAAPRSPADGGGRAWLESDAAATAMTPGRWTVIYEAGPLGVAEGGAVYLMTSPFWGWSTPQTFDADLHGYTEVTTDAEGLTLEAAAVDAQLLQVRVAGRALAPAERIRFVFGAGAALAGPDRFAERDERFWVAVDGDGDGVRGLLKDSPRIDVAPGPPARLVLTLQSTARAGEPARLVAAVLDASSSAARFDGELTLDALPDGLAGPTRFALRDGVGETSVAVHAPGVYRLAGRSGKLEAVSNPLVVDGAAPLLWADLHGHSQLSDGTATPEDFFRYARDVAALDVVALTDHDHWGVRFLDERPDLWETIRSQVRRFHTPGRFVTLLGYEWTSWIHGHRHVLYFGDEGRIYSSLDEATDDPRELWAALSGQPALTFAHHSAGGPIPTNWAIPPDPVFEPVTEVVSVHGSSEALDAPGLIYSPIPGNFVRDVLDRGLRLGFVGSGDSHDGHPGLAHLESASGGLAALLSPERTRDAVLDALRARRSYATNGPRIVLRTRLAGHPMGSVLPHAAVREGARLQVAVYAPGELSRIELVRSGAPGVLWEQEGLRDVSFEVALDDLKPGEYLYLRAVQLGGGAAWSSPFFIE
jgi:hypothetical protein